MNPTSKVCIIGEKLGNEKVLLLGNSHADSIKTVFKDAMDQRRITTFFYVANNPLMSPSHNDEMVMSEILDNAITTVVIHYSPSFYDDEVNVEILKRFIFSLQEEDIQFYFIAPVPISEFHVPKLMLRLHMIKSNFM